MRIVPLIFAAMVRSFNDCYVQNCLECREFSMLTCKVCYSGFTVDSQYECSRNALDTTPSSFSAPVAYTPCGHSLCARCSFFSDKCMLCTPGYTLDHNGECLEDPSRKVSGSMASFVCKDSSCALCDFVASKCVECKPNYSLDSDGKCSFTAFNTTTSPSPTTMITRYCSYSVCGRCKFGYTNKCSNCRPGSVNYTEAAECESDGRTTGNTSRSTPGGAPGRTTEKTTEGTTWIRLAPGTIIIIVVSAVLCVMLCGGCIVHYAQKQKSKKKKAREMEVCGFPAEPNEQGPTPYSTTPPQGAVPYTTTPPQSGVFYANTQPQDLPYGLPVPDGVHYANTEQQDLPYGVPVPDGVPPTEDQLANAV
eukprot:GEMP01037974.1.p1 GENE.GEMP01037974.1~~GEMP01037974.1.p1  ORF type:complete len:364 (+),score=28.79 GEMP01037974.1:140-1231(+)